jgi:hypothetical protein
MTKHGSTEALKESFLELRLTQLLIHAVNSAKAIEQHAAFQTTLNASRYSKVLAAMHLRWSMCAHREKCAERRSITNALRYPGA